MLGLGSAATGAALQPVLETAAETCILKTRVFTIDAAAALSPKPILEQQPAVLRTLETLDTRPILHVYM